MRALKKIMAGAIATAIAATMATSAFAASFADGKVGFATATEGVYDYNAVGQTTVLVVPAAKWTGTAIADGLLDSDILYINQYEDANEANAAIIAGFGVKVDAETGTLADGDYYALFGGNTGADGAFAITAVAFNVTTTPEGPVLKWCDVNQDGQISAQDVTSLLRHTSNIEPLTFTEAELLVVCDVNKDNEVSAQDVTRLLRHTSNIEPIEGLE